MDNPPNGGSHGTHIVIPTAIFYLLITASGFGGFGSGSFISSKSGGEGISECSVTAKAALELGVQQARHISDLQDQLAYGTRARFTKDDHEKYAREQEAQHDVQDRRISLLERIMDKG